MNSEFHYYTTWFLAVKAGWSVTDSARLAWACQYTDHHHRETHVKSPGRVIGSLPTQNYSFWNADVVRQSFVPFHFLPAGSGWTTVRRDGRTSPRDVRPNSPGAKALLVEALKSRQIERIGIALHTFADTWAHQNFTAWSEDFNSLESSGSVPSPGHAQAGWRPDEWLTTWTDSRLIEPVIDNQQRFSECARKIFRYLCLYRGTAYEAIEDAVAEELTTRIAAGRGRDSLHERMLEFIIDYDMEPYDRDGPILRTTDGLVPDELSNPALEKIRTISRDLWSKTGLAAPVILTARPNFAGSPFSLWLEGADAHRRDALSWVDTLAGVWS